MTLYDQFLQYSAQRDHMTDGLMLRFGKLKREGLILQAAKHNLRTIPTDKAGGHIDPRKSRLNEVVAGPADPDEVARLAKARIKAAGIGKTRKDAVRAIECIVSLRPGEVIDERAYFADSAAWLAENLVGADNLLSAVVHRDESACHMHVLLLPLIHGRLQGSWALGGKSKLGALCNSFFNEVGARYGLRPAAKLTKGERERVITMVLEELRNRQDPCLSSRLWPGFRDDINARPAWYATELGISLSYPRPKKRLRSSTAIFTSKGRGSQRPSAG